MDKNSMRELLTTVAGAMAGRKLGKSEPLGGLTGGLVGGVGGWLSGEFASALLKALGEASRAAECRPGTTSSATHVPASNELMREARGFLLGYCTGYAILMATLAAMGLDLENHVSEQPLRTRLKSEKDSVERVFAESMRNQYSGFVETWRRDPFVGDLADRLADLLQIDIEAEIESGTRSLADAISRY